VERIGRVICEIKVNLTKYTTRLLQTVLQEPQLLNPKPSQTPGMTYWPVTRPKIVDPVTRDSKPVPTLVPSSERIYFVAFRLSARITPLHLALAKANFPSGFHLASTCDVPRIASLSHYFTRHLSVWNDKDIRWNVGRDNNFYSLS